VCSILSHYVKYAAEGVRKINNPVMALVLRACLSFLSLVLKAGRADKVVYVNNWLLTTNPCPTLSPEQIGRITTALIERFPDYAIVFRSVNTLIYKGFFDALQKNRYIMVRSRRVYIINPTDKAFLKSRNVKRDLNLISKTSYEILDADQLDEADVRRIAELYHALYLRKYSFFNPQFNEKFFLHMLKQKIFAFQALRKNGRIDAFIGYYLKRGGLTGACLGYDVQLHRELRLFRLAFALAMAEAKKRGVMLHLSAGVGAFKMFRGTMPCIEFDAVYDEHLPFHRRLAWRCLKLSLDGWQRAEPLLLREADMPA